MVCALLKAGMIEARAFRRNETFEAALRFARQEGILAAPESVHAIRAAIDEALRAKEAGEECVSLFGLCGHGNFDLAALRRVPGRQARGPGVLSGGHGRRDSRARRGAGRGVRRASERRPRAQAGI